MHDARTPNRQNTIGVNGEIREWLNRQHAWLKEAAFRLLSNGGISDDDLEKLIELIKTPPEEGQEYDYPTIGASESESVLKLVSVGLVTGVDALNPQTPLPLSENALTVVYGDNGSGKSGYVRLLKRISGKSNSPELKPNVYQNVPSSRECTICFEINSEIKEVQWEVNSAPIEELNVVDVFDTHSGAVYLGGETELSYSPPELSFFSELVEISRRVETKLKEESNGLVSKLPPCQQAHSGTAWIAKYGRLRHDLSEEQIAGFTKWDEEDEKAIDELRKRLAATDPVSEAKKRRAAKQQAEHLRNEIVSFRNKLGSDGIAQLKGLFGAAVSKRKEAIESVAAFTENAKLEGIGSETWRSLWLAAREYSIKTAYPERPYPFTDDESRCVLCHQELDADAKKRLIDFESYVSSKLETDAKKSEDILKNAIDSLSDVPTDQLLFTKCKAAELSDELSQKLEELYTNLRIALNLVREKKFGYEFPEVDELASQVEVEIGKIAVELGKIALKFDEDAKLFDREKASKDLLELEARKWVSEQKEAIQAEVQRLARVQKLNEAVARASTTGISRKAGEISEMLITAAYVRRFNEELRKLGATRVQVELVKTRTQQGRSKHQIQLKDLQHPGIRPSEILSEGEHRIVAIAAFLADVTGKSANVPFVFDDPITSLSSNYEEKVAARLIELSAQRQVIVFSHRLSLLSILSGKADDVCCHQLRSGPHGTGDHGMVPYFKKDPVTVLNTLRNHMLPPVRAMHENGEIEAYQFNAKSLCSELRVQIEHIVEKILLGDVVKRHRRELHSQKIMLLAKITEEDCSYLDQLMSKYSCFEHSQSEEIDSQIPEPADLDLDLQELVAWCTEFKRR